MSYAIKVPSLGEFYNMLDGHDWYYSFSDDHSKYMAGTQFERRLDEIAKSSPEHKKLYDAFASHHFSGEPWRTEKMPKPVRPV